MNQHFTESHAYIFSKSEMLCLLETFGVKSLLGTELNLSHHALSKRTQKAGLNALEKRNLIFAPFTKSEINQALLPLLVPLFSPEKALLVIRSHIEIGEQVLVFLSKENKVVLLSFPSTEKYRVASIQDVQALQEMLLSWFPIHSYTAKNVELCVDQTIFDQVRTFAEQKQEDEALRRLDEVSGEDQDKLLLIQTIAHRIFSGSFAKMTLQNETIVEAESTAVLAGASSGWLITQAKPETSLCITQTGKAFVSFVADLAQHLFSMGGSLE